MTREHRESSVLQESHWKGAAEKRVYRQYIKLLRRLILQRKPRISEDNVDSCGRIPQITERSLGYSHHLRIDFVEAKVVAGPPVRGDRARTQSDRTHALRIWAAVRERKPHAGIRSVVGSRQKARRRSDVL